MICHLLRTHQNLIHWDAAHDWAIWTETVVRHMFLRLVMVAPFELYAQIRALGLRGDHSVRRTSHILRGGACHGVIANVWLRFLILKNNYIQKLLRNLPLECGTYVFHLRETFDSLGMDFVSVVDRYSSCFGLQQHMPIPSSATERFAAGSSSSLVDAINAASFTFLKYYIKGYPLNSN